MFKLYKGRAFVARTVAAFYAHFQQECCNAACFACQR